MSGPARPDIPALNPEARKAAEAAYRNWRIGDDGEGRLHAALLAYAAAGSGEAEKPHRPGPRRMVARDLAPADCLSCGERWPCEASWRSRAGAAEAKLAAISALCAEGRPAVAVDRIEAILRDGEGT